MDFLICAINPQIIKQFKTYKHKSIAKQVFDLIITQFNSQQINCAICGNSLPIKQYIDHLVKHSQLNTFLTQDQLLILGQSYHYGTYTDKNKHKALDYYEQVIILDAENSIANTNLQIISILPYL